MFRSVSRRARQSLVRNLTLLRHVESSTVDHLRKHGYAVQDDVLPSHTFSLILKEAHELIQSGLATPNKTHVVSHHESKTFEKSTVLQAEMNTLPQACITKIPTLSSLQNDSSLCTMISVLWPRLTLKNQSLKIQRSSGTEACFPIHIDTSPSRDSRIVTALLYPHESWSSHEGALRIYKDPLSFVDVHPLPGRLVLVAAAQMHHRVMPANDDRYALTMWLSGKLRPLSMQPPEDLPLSANIAYHLLAPAFRDMTFRVALEKEWISSLHESHSPILAEELANDFRRNLSVIREVLPGVLSRREGLQKCAHSEIQEVLSSSAALKSAYHSLESACGEIPFVW